MTVVETAGGNKPMREILYDESGNPLVPKETHGPIKIGDDIELEDGRIVQVLSPIYDNALERGFKCRFY